MSTAPDDWIIPPPVDQHTLDALSAIDNDPANLEMLQLVEQAADAQAAELRELLGGLGALTAEEMARIDAELDAICPPDRLQE